MYIILLLLIFIRPFISSLAYPYLNSAYIGLSAFLVSFWIIARRRHIGLNRQVAAAILVFLLGITFAALFSAAKALFLQGLGIYFAGILFFLFAASLTGKERELLLSFMTWAALIIALLAIYQYFFGFRNTLEYIRREDIADLFARDYISRQRVFFPFVTPNILAVYLGMLLFLVTTRRNRILYIIPISFALFLTKSLGVFLSLTASLMIYFHLKGKLKKRQILILCGLLVFFGLIFAVREKTQKIHQTPVFSTLMRLEYWNATLQVIKSHPLAGVGPGNFNLAQSRYAHNSYLQIWAEVGLIGLLPFIWFLISAAGSWGKKIKQAQQPNIYLAGTAAAGLFLLHNFIDFGFFLPEVSLIWWLIAGMLFAGASEASLGNTSGDPDRP